MKLRCLELEVLNATYTKDSVAALRKVVFGNVEKMRTNSEAEFTSKGAREAVPPVGGKRAGAFQPTILFEAISGKTTNKSQESTIHKTSPGSWP